jgi:hypothetical protein
MINWSDISLQTLRQPQQNFYSGRIMNDATVILFYYSSDY